MRGLINTNTTNLKEVKKEILKFCGNEEEIKRIIKEYDVETLMAFLRESFNAALDALETDLYSSYDGDISKKVSYMYRTIDSIPLYLIEKDELFWTRFDKNIMM